MTCRTGIVFVVTDKVQATCQPTLQCVECIVEATGSYWTYIAFHPMMKLKAALSLFDERES